MAVLANSVQELEPLITACRAGKLFDVQEWVQQGKPIALADGIPSRSNHHIPLQVAIAAGFHSVVEALLSAGAPVQQRSYDALQHAVELGRAELVELLLKHGARASDVAMSAVIENGCRPEMVDMLLTAGASLVDGSPIAWGLIDCIRPTLGLVKRFVGRHPELLQQVNTALRFHAGKGNEKWVALTLWVGGDPLAQGPDHPDQADDDGTDLGMCALELAAWHGKLDMLKQGKMARAVESAAGTGDAVMRAACFSAQAPVLAFVLERGHSPRQLPDYGTSLIETLIGSMAFALVLDRIRTHGDSQAPADSYRAREAMGMVHMLLAHGARWLPKDKHVITSIRRSLLRLVPPFSVEFAWLLKSYGAARRADVLALFATPAMRRHIGAERARLDKIISAIPEALPQQEHQPHHLSPPEAGAASVADVTYL